MARDPSPCQWPLCPRSALGGLPRAPRKSWGHLPRQAAVCTRLCALAQDRGRERVPCTSWGEQVRPSPKPACLGSEPSLAPGPQGDLTSVPQASYLQNGNISSRQPRSREYHEGQR